MSLTSQDASPIVLQLRELRIKLMQSGVLEAFETHLAKLLPDLPSAYPTADKILKDRVWGTIRIPGLFVPLVDTRMLQRQRRVRQLGMSYLIYPSAGYSRFEHALGCFHSMDSLLTSISSRPGSTVPTQHRQRQLLLGALLHDVGHMPFSHASERAMEALLPQLVMGPISAKDVADWLNEAIEKKVRLAEVLSVLVLFAPRTHRFLAPLVPTDYAHPKEDFFLEIAAFILGARLSNADLACSQVLSGPVDADKIDYMTRDAMVTGVPVSVDISRLLARCSFREVALDNLPQGMRESAGEDKTKPVLFVTGIAGTNALEELTVSRFILYDRIYNHHKTKAAESVLHELLLRGAESGALSRDVLHFWTLSDEALLHTLLGSDATRELAERILYRELPKRAVVYAEKLISRPMLPFQFDARDEQSMGSKLAQLVMPLVGQLGDAIDKAFGINEERLALQSEIRQRAEQLSQQLGVASGYQPKTALHLVTVCPRPNSPFTATSEALVIDLDEKITTFRQHMPIDQWSAAFSLNKRFGYVFSDPEWSSLVHIATELVLWERYPQKASQIELRFRLNEAAQPEAKLGRSTIHRIKTLLDGKGVFDQARPLRPLKVNQARLEPLARRFAAFQGTGGWRISVDSIESFVRQFPMRLQEQVCQVLERFEFLDRALLCSAVQSTLSKILIGLSVSSVQIVGLTPNSGGLVQMLAEQDLRSALGTLCHFPKDGIEAAVRNGETVILVDDLSSSGSQASVQIQAWMGVPRNDWLDPTERNIFEQPLPIPLADKLKCIPVHLVLARGTAAGRQRIESIGHGLGLKNLKVHFQSSIEPPPLDALSSELRTHLAQIGIELLMGVRKDAKREECERDALGYDGRTGFIISLFNVPTCCPPALWCPGTIQNIPWVPLFIRRGYQDRAVFL